MSKHTPGPWEKRFHYSGAPIIVTDERQVAKVLYHGGSEDNEVHANAKLIAAAPDMYEALEQCELFLCEMSYTDEQLLPLVQAAIVKARG